MTDKILTFAEQRSALEEAFPILLSGKPLAIGIIGQVKANMPKGVSVRNAQRFVHHVTSRGNYIAALASGEHRVNLDGSDAGPPSPEHVAFAAGEIKGFSKAKLIYKSRKKKEVKIPISSPELYRFYRLWRRKANSLFFKGHAKDGGLCVFAYRKFGSAICSEMKRQFSAAGLSRAYPFGGEVIYNDEVREGTAHLNILRINWVDDRIREYEEHLARR